MKKALYSILFFLSVLFPAQTQARVYWIGRNIDMALQFGVRAEGGWKMVRAYGHSLLAVIPQDPDAFARLYNPRNPQAYFTELEKDFGNGYKGFVIAAYAENGTQSIGHADGYLVARVNAAREIQPLRDFFAGTGQDKWNFAAGEVFSPFSDEEFALRLLQLAQSYMTLSHRKPVPYGTVNSIIEPVTRHKPDRAVNCNAFAYSLVRYAGATGGPDLYAQRVMTGIANLLPAKLFFKNPPNPLKLPSYHTYSARDARAEQERDFRRKIIKKSISAVQIKPTAKDLNLLK